MKYRIFQLAVQLQSDHPQFSVQRTSSLAHGYTSADELEKAKTVLRQECHIYKVSILKIESHVEFSALEEVSEFNSRKRLMDSAHFPCCYIEPYITG